MSDEEYIASMEAHEGRLEAEVAQLRALLYKVECTCSSVGRNTECIHCAALSLSRSS